jgi:hypothetical protein
MSPSDAGGWEGIMTQKSEASQTLESQRWKAEVGICCNDSVLAVLGFSIQGLALARQALYHLYHNPSFFVLGYFSGRVFHFFAWGWLQTVIHDPPTFTSRAGIVGTNHHAQLVGWGEVSLFLGWPRTMILSISVSQRAGITGMTHHIWPHKQILRVTFTYILTRIFLPKKYQNHLQNSS